MAHQFLSAKIIKPPPTSLPPSAKFASNWNFYSYFCLLHTINFTYFRFKIRMSNGRHTYTALFGKNTCKTPKKEVFSYSRQALP